MTTFDPARRLAPSFTWGELVVTNVRGLADENAQRSTYVLDSLTATATMLQAVRDHFCAPVIVHSGYRCPQLNAVVGGSATSQHVKGEAVDFHVHGNDLRTVFDWIRRESGLPFGQLILEGHQGGAWTWIHLSLGEPWRPLAKCRQAMSWSKATGYVQVAA